MKKNILVTGCNGQLGTEVKRLSVLYPQYNYFFTEHYNLDITNEEAINYFVEHYNIKGIINCAAYTAVDKAEDEFEKARAINANAIAYLAKSMDECGGFLVHISTDYVFDGKACTPYSEDIPVHPLSVYGLTKEEGEQNARFYCKNTVIIRTSWVYSTTGNNFVKTMLRLGKERPELGVVFDQIGTPTFARDLAGAIFTILEHGIVPGTYHYSNEGAISWYDFTKAIHKIAGITSCCVRPIRSAEYPVKAARPSFSVLDKTLTKKTFAIRIPYWEDSLETCIHELKNNER